MPAAEARIPIPQTNLQLYRAMRENGHSETAVGQANEAWLLAAESTTGMFRGSGKPFACHLAGVAGLLCLAEQPSPVVTAGLLHAMYQDRVPFLGRQRPLDERRRYLAEHFGEECEQLVHGYHEFEVEHLDAWSDQALLGKGPVVLMRVADELEDMLEDAIELHGRRGDSDDIRGGAAARRSKSLRLGPELKRAARLFDCTFLERELDIQLARLEARSQPSMVRTGQYSSFTAPIGSRCE
jgi:hypothetical protein